MRASLLFFLLLPFVGQSQDIQKKLQLEFHGAYYPVDTVQRNFAKTHKIKSITQVQYLYVNGQAGKGTVSQKEEYDNNGNLTNSWRQSVQNTFAYDAYGNRSSSTEIHPKDVALHDSVLVSKRMMTHNNAGRITQTWNYNLDWNTHVMSSPASPDYVYAYDSLGRVVDRKFQAAGATPWVEHFVYAPAEVRVYRLNATTDPLDSNRIDRIYRYNTKRLLVFEGNPKGKYREYAYDSLGNKTMQRDMSAYMPNVELERQDFEYDATGQLKKYTQYNKGKFANEARHTYGSPGKILLTQYKFPTSSYSYKYQYNTNGLKSVQTCEENGHTNWQTKFIYTYYP